MTRSTPSIEPADTPPGESFHAPRRPPPGEGGVTFDRPIVTVGSPRSGTSILSDLLQSHPDVVFLDEPRFIWRWGNDRKSDVFAPEDARPEVRDYIRRRFHQQLTEAAGKRLVEKTPANALRLGFVDRVLPEARYIHMIRHGVDSIISIRSFWTNHARGVRDIKPGRFTQRLREISPRRLPAYAKEAARRILPGRLSRVFGRAVWGPRLPGIEAMLRDLDLLEVCALQWRMSVELACHFGRSLPPERYLECRLEDMNESKLREILAFCELEDHPDTRGYFREHFDASAIGARRAAADPADVETIRRWIEPTMQWLGYEMETPKRRNAERGRKCLNVQTDRDSRQ